MCAWSPAAAAAAAAAAAGEGRGLPKSIAKPLGGILTLEGGAGVAGEGQPRASWRAKCRSGTPGVPPCVCLFGLADVKHTHADSQPQGLCAEPTFNP